MPFENHIHQFPLAVIMCNIGSLCYGVANVALFNIPYLSSVKPAIEAIHLIILCVTVFTSKEFLMIFFTKNVVKFCLHHITMINV